MTSLTLSEKVPNFGECWSFESKSPLSSLTSLILRRTLFSDGIDILGGILTKRRFFGGKRVGFAFRCRDVDLISSHNLISV